MKPEVGGALRWSGRGTLSLGNITACAVTMDTSILADVTTTLPMRDLTVPITTITHSMALGYIYIKIEGFHVYVHQSVCPSICPLVHQSQKISKVLEGPSGPTVIWDFFVTDAPTDRQMDRWTDGHTHGNLLFLYRYKGSKVIFPSDKVPCPLHLSAPPTSGFKDYTHSRPEVIV